MRFLHGLVFIVGAILGLRWGAFTGDGGSGGGTGQGGDGGGAQGQGGQGQGGQGGGDGGAQGQGGQQGTTYTQADLDRIVNERMADAQRKADAKAEADRKKAEADDLAKKAEWQKLAEQRGAELEQLKGRAETADAYATRLNTWVEAEIKDWPTEVKALDPGKDSLTARLDWLEKSRPLAAKLSGTAKPANTEAGAGNRQAGGQGGQQGQGSQGAGQGQGGQQQSQRYRFQSPGDVTW